jgi:hypothetical protein
MVTPLVEIAGTVELVIPHQINTKMTQYQLGPLKPE